MKLFRYALRRLRRAPAFTFIAVLTLALGIGANTAIFSVVNGVLLKPLSYPHPESLVGVWHVAPGVPGIGNDKVDCAPAMYFTYREENHTFQEIGLWSNGSVPVTGLAEPEQVDSLWVTYGTLQALAVQPALGRWFSQADDTPGSPQTVILSYGYWQRRFGGNPNVLGRTLTVDSRPRTIVGVMPAGFRFLEVKADVILPQRFDRKQMMLGQFSYQGIARLKPGVTIQQADADVARMIPIWLNEWPAPPGLSRSLFVDARLGPKIQPLKQEVVGDLRSTLWVLMGTIGLVLLIACANVANLLLVRAEGRQQELSVRAALGAGWGRIARELLAESVALSIAGGALGLGLAFGAQRLLVAIGPASLPRLGEIGIDPLVLAFTFLVSILSGLLFGLIPVVKYAGPRTAERLRGGGRTMSHGRERHRTRDALVVLQVSLALVLLIGSGLMIRTFQALRNVQPGFTHPEQIQLLHLSIPDAGELKAERITRIQNGMLDKLASIPGVSAAAFADTSPLEPGATDVLYAEDKNYAAGQFPPTRRFRFITPGFLKTTGTPLIAGRDFTWDDLYENHHVAMISENMAREMWGSPRAALGKRIREGSADPWREVIGVTGDVRDDGLQTKAPGIVYWPALMDSFWGMRPFAHPGVVFLIRSSRAATESFLSEARQAIWSINRNFPIYRMRTLRDVYAGSMARTSFTLVMLAIAGAMALLLGIVGIYGVIAYAVSQRSREIGIRMALGAQPAVLRRMFVRHGLVLAGVGAAIGLFAAAGLTRLMTSLLFGTSALDPVTYTAVSVVLVAAAALASYVPARRASGIDPVKTLRSE